jgi:hypothetical protein
MMRMSIVVDSTSGRVLLTGMSVRQRAYGEGFTECLAARIKKRRSKPAFFIAGG